MTDPLQPVWSVLEAIEPVLTPDGWRRIPLTTREALLATELVVRGPKTERVRCPVCARAHYERPFVRPGPDGQPREFILCPQEMRVQIEAADRQTWRVDVEAIAAALANSAGLVGGVRSMGSDRLYHCGQHTHRGVRIEVYLARGLRRRDGAVVAASVPRSLLPPIVFVPQDQPDSAVWSNSTTVVIPLRTAARLEEGALVIDGRVIEQAAMRLTRDYTAASNIFRLRGEFWELGFDGGDVKHLKDSVGLAYLARVLAEPHQSIPAVTLLASRAGIDPRIPTGSSGQSLDERARTEMQHKYAELMERRAESERHNDLGTLTAVDEQIEQLTVELNRRLGLGGRAREDSDAERVRKSVSMAVTREIDRIEGQLPELGRHLRAAVSTGRLFKYAPDREIEWLL